MDMNKRLVNIVHACVEEYNEQHLRQIPIEMGLQTPLYGKDGLLDSIGLITLLVCVEQEIEDQLGTEIPLIQQSMAMSTKESPFKTVAHLVAFIQEVMELRTPEEV